MIPYYNTYYIITIIIIPCTIRHVLSLRHGGGGDDGGRDGGHGLG